MLPHIHGITQLWHETQFAILPEGTANLDATAKQCILKAHGTHLYSVHGIDLMLLLLTDIGELTSEPSKGP